jgi:hypothetical protein
MLFNLGPPLALPRPPSRCVVSIPSHLYKPLFIHQVTVLAFRSWATEIEIEIDLRVSDQPHVSLQQQVAVHVLCLS